MTHRNPINALLLASIGTLFAACGVLDKPIADSDTASDSSGSTSSAESESSTEATTTAATTSAASAATTTATTTATGDTAATTSEMPPVQCGDATCEAGQLCVFPAPECDENHPSGMPTVVYPPPMCAAMPDECAGMIEQALRDCLDVALCQASLPPGAPPPPVPPTFEMGVLECSPPWADCI